MKLKPAAGLIVLTLALATWAPIRADARPISVDPAPAIRLRPPPVQHRAFAALSRNNLGARRILGRLADDAKLRDLMAAARQLPRATRLVSQSDEVLRALRTRNAQVISIVAHNENGFLVFQDGARLSLAQLEKARLAGGQKHLVVIGCNTGLISTGQIIGLTDSITLGTGTEIQRRFHDWMNAWVRQQRVLPPRHIVESKALEIASAVQSEKNTGLALRGSQTRVRVVYGVTAGGTLILVVGYEQKRPGLSWSGAW